MRWGGRTLRAFRPLALQLTPDDWLNDFQSSLTATLGGKVIRVGLGGTWQTGSYVVQCSVVATKPPVVCMITIEVSEIDDTAPDMRFVFKHRDDPFASAQIVASWLYGRRTRYQNA